MQRIAYRLVVCALVALIQTKAHATEEIISAYDAKSTGMGLTGTAWVNNSAAAYHNAANLGAVKRFDAVLALAPNISRVRSPYLTLVNRTPTVLSASSQPVLTPLGFAGVAWRPHHVLALGLASGLTQVAGVSYKNVPFSLLQPSQVGLLPGTGTATAYSMLWDTRLSVALNLTSWLSIGGGWRMAFGHERVLYSESGTKVLDGSFNGQRYNGGYAGLTVKPHRQVRLAASYRSKLNVATKGVLSGQPGQPGATIIEPHQLSAGAAVQLANNRVMLAADYKHWFYRDAVKGEILAVQESYVDAMSGHIGVEWLALPTLPLRAGFVVGRSKVAKAGAFATRMPPGMVFGGTVGAGYRLPLVDLDLAFGYGGMNERLEAPPATMAGKYGLDVWLLQLSANVHI